MNNTLKVIGGSAHPTLVNEICKNLGVPPCSVTLDTFPGRRDLRANQREHPRP
jgi:phosphoribosylpyrophosphate synthetase